MDTWWTGAGLIVTALAWMTENWIGGSIAPVLLLATGVVHLVAVRRPAAA